MAKGCETGILSERICLVVYRVRLSTDLSERQ